MITCSPDPAIQRVSIGEFTFPLGVYPVEPLTPVAGYRVEFEPADGAEPDQDLDDAIGEAGGGPDAEPAQPGVGGGLSEVADGGEGQEWEEWPDRYVFDIVVSAARLMPLLRSLLSLMPGRIYPILDVLGHDGYREVDPYIAYHPVGIERFIDGMRRFGAFLVEDGLCGFGAISEEPFYYIFVDEHKIVTVRAEAALKERVERTLAAFDLGPIEEPAGVDAVAHEHRGVLIAPESDAQLLLTEEVVERLIDAWRLTLNIDIDSNIDDDGRPLGMTLWRCLVRSSPESGSVDPLIGPRNATYWEALLTARNWRDAEELALDTIDATDPPRGEEHWPELAVITADRLTPAQFEELTGGKHKVPSMAKTATGRIILLRRLEQ